MSQESMILGAEALQISSQSQPIPNLAFEDPAHLNGVPNDARGAGAGQAEFQPSPGSTPPVRSSSPGSHSQDSCHMEGVEEKGELDVVVKRARVERTNSALVSGIACYKMDAKPRGLALIIEIEEYMNDVQDKRIGSHSDVTNLKRLFKALSFEVEVKRNPAKRDFDREINDFARRDEHRKSDMMILAILSHGRDGHIYTSDGSVVATETIYEKFNNQNCPALDGKPKFFIIQACRGDETDLGHRADVDEYSRTVAPRKRRAGTDRDSFPFTGYGEMDRARPTWEDMIMAYSTIPGFASIRDHEKGTWFIQSLVEVFMNHAHDKELIDLLRMTSERLSQFTNEDNEKQTCNVEMRHLYKRIYFNPGLPFAHPSPKAFRRSRSTPPASPRRRPEPDSDIEEV